MALEHDRFRRLLTGMDNDGGQFSWHHVVALLQAITAERSDESEAALREVAVLTGRLDLQEDAGLPHAMAPEDLLRLIAVRKLGEWDPVTHHDVIVQMALTADSERVPALARRVVAF